MAVREFNGTTDQLICGVGAASGMTYGTAAVLVKFSSLADFVALTHLHDSGGTFLWIPIGLSNFSTWLTFIGSGSNYGSVSTGIWYLAVARKATGTATPRLSIYNYTAASWSHTNGDAALGDGTAPGASGTIQFSYQAGTGDMFPGRVAARALWSNTLPWTADASGDTALQSSGLKDAAASWLSANPSAFWLFNQASTATPVDDLSTTGTADQTSITGTTVVSGDDPPGFDFSLSAPPPQPVAVQAAQPFPAF